KALFPRSHAVGEAFGVIIVRQGRISVEVVTFRKEWGYADGRRPDNIVFTDAQHDAQRRDFTINGLFEDPLAADPAQRIIDYVDAQTALRSKTIRAIGTPDARFAEDHLRMLRAVRIASRLAFAIHPDTAAAIRANADKLRLISRERIGQEMNWTLTGP